MSKRLILLTATLAVSLAACQIGGGTPTVLNEGISGTVTLGTGIASEPAASVVGATPAEAPKPFKPDWSLPHVKGQVLIISAGSTVSPASAPSLRGLTVSPVAVGISSVQVPASEEAAVAARIAAETGVVTQPNYIYRSLAEAPTPNDERYAEQFYLTQIDAPGGWAVRTAGATVAVLDTGADFTHPDLQGRLIRGRDFCPNLVPVGSDPNNVACEGEDDDPTDLPNATVDGNGGHGTHTAGIIAAQTNNHTGIAGITWSGQVLVVKVFGADALGSGATTVSLSNGLRYAANFSGVRVINLSLGLPTYNTTTDPDQIVATAIAYADSKDVLMVAASGNYQPSTPDAQKTLFYPASNPTVLAVGAVDPSNTISGISARGPEQDLVAPGQGVGFNRLANAYTEGILSTRNGGGYEFRVGTSEAAPQVSAVASLVRGLKPSLTSLETKSILRTTARDLGAPGNDPLYGSGLVQAGAALRKVAAGTAPADPVQPPVSQQDRTVYVYADRLVNGQFNGNDAKSGRTTVILPAGQRSVTFKITQSRDGTPLQAGTYRVVASINANANGQACDTGDLCGLGTPSPIVYTGRLVSGVSVTLTAAP